MEVLPLVKHCAIPELPSPDTTALFHLQSSLWLGLMAWFFFFNSMMWAIWFWSDGQCRGLKRLSGDRLLMKKEGPFLWGCQYSSLAQHYHYNSYITCIKMYRLWNLLLNVWKIMKIIHFHQQKNTKKWVEMCKKIHKTEE